MPKSKGGWIQTYAGKQVYPLDPDPESIVIEDIAHSLAHICRYNGHSTKFYSVAEHCCLLSTVMQDNGLQLLALLHDAAEAYLGDVVRPMKGSTQIYNGSYLELYRDVEHKLLESILAKFGLPYIDTDMQRIFYADHRLLATEKEQVFPGTDLQWEGLPMPYDLQLRFWTPTQAEVEYLRIFQECYK